MKSWLQYCIRFLRRLTGDDAYERYLEHCHQCHAGEPMLDRRQFYVVETQRKWSGVKRCC
jgi:uncharacterized short protein YbdD (DUF466 family)